MARYLVRTGQDELVVDNPRVAAWVMALEQVAGNLARLYELREVEIGVEELPEFQDSHEIKRFTIVQDDLGNLRTEDVNGNKIAGILCGEDYNDPDVLRELIRDTLDAIKSQ